MGHRRLGAGIAAIVVLLVGPAHEALGATRLAAPAGAGADPSCVDSPCTLLEALAVAAPGDAVEAAPGLYDLGLNAAQVGNGITLRARHDATPPVIRGSGNWTVDALPGSALSRVQVVNTQSESAAVVVHDGATMRDSTAWASGASAAAVRLDAAGLPAPALVNVTAVATDDTSGYGILAGDGDDGPTGTNVIAAGPKDLDTLSGAPTFALSNSNFDTAGGTITVDGSGNQTAAPVLADPGTGDFHQLAGSPTIDAGKPGPPLGPLDLDGGARVAGAAPDIGADEYVPPPPPPPGDESPDQGGTPGGEPGGDPLGPLQGTPVSGLRVLGISVSQPVVVGQRSVLTIQALDTDAPIAGALVRFGAPHGSAGALACRLGTPFGPFLPGQPTTIRVPFRLRRAGRHTFRIAIHAGRCRRTARTVAATFSFDAAPAGARARSVAVAVAAQAGCRNANVLPTRRNTRAMIKATLCLLNRERAANGLKPLRINRRLARAARMHNRTMIRRLTFAHTVPGEPALPQRLRRVRYRHGAGENIGAAEGDPYATPAGMLDGWMESPGHRANILDGTFRTVGIAVAPRKPAPSPPDPGASYTTVFGTSRR